MHGVADPIQLDEQDLRIIEAAIETLDPSIEDERELKMGVIK